MEENEKKKKQKEEDIQNQIIGNASYDTVQRYGSAAKEHYVAYSGVDNETGQTYSKSLKSISESKTHPDYKDQNIKQQSGYSAEVKATAKENAEKAIKGEKTRTTRTDDMKTQSDGKGESVGGKNDQLYDLAEVDENGNYIEGSGRQLKFVGSNADECADKLLSKKYDKYRDADVEIEVASDHYDEVKNKLTEKSEKLSKQIEDAEKKGDTERANKLKKNKERVDKTNKNLRKSKVSSEEAKFAREHPVLSTAVDTVKVANRAGLEAAGQSALIGGSISIIKNTVSLLKGDEEPEDALKNIAKDTGSAAASGYTISFFGSIVKGAMQNSKSDKLQVLSKTNVPTQIVTAVIDIGKTMGRYFKGDISGIECLEQLGEGGVTKIAGSLGFLVGQTAIPIPVVGGMIGSMVGYAIASASYSELLTSLKEAKQAHEDRMRIERECQEHIVLIRQYRAELEENINRYLATNIIIFHESFDQIKSALNIGDIDGFISGTNQITKALGKKPQFETMGEFDILMQSTYTFKL